MARNLGSPCCAVCGGIVRLDTADPYLSADLGQDATCETCGVKYQAQCNNPIRDLSFRVSLNDEPAPEDCPTKEPWASRYPWCCYRAEFEKHSCGKPT